MFRLLNVRKITFKAREKKDVPSAYDIVVTNGFVKPLSSDDFAGPNGATLRPNTYEEYYIICGRSAKSYLCEIPKGTKVPDQCILVHEFGDHFSLQPKIEIPIADFDQIVTKFLLPCKVYKRDEWLQQHPLGSQMVL